MPAETLALALPPAPRMARLELDLGSHNGGMRSSVHACAPQTQLIRLTVNLSANNSTAKQVLSCAKPLVVTLFFSCDAYMR